MNEFTRKWAKGCVMIDGTLIDNIRYTIDTYYAQFGLPNNRGKRPSAICQAITANTGNLYDRRPIRNLLLKEPLEHSPAEQTIDIVLNFIIINGPYNDSGPIIQSGWFSQSHDDDFKEKITKAFQEGQRLRDSDDASAEQIRPVQKYCSQFEELAHFIVSPDYGEQDLAKSFVSSYLIFRYIERFEEWAVSYMIIHPPRQKGTPCWFETHGPPQLDTYSDNEDEEVVCGLFFEPPTRPRLFHAIGRHIEKDGQGQWYPTLELRSAYVKGARRQGIKGRPRDLFGARLGPGRVLGEPQGYAMWCARLTENISSDDISKFVAQFHKSDTTKVDVYKTLIPSLDFVLNWVSSQDYLSIQGDFKL